MINLGAIWTTGCDVAYYIDPGTGTLLVQLLAAAALSAVFFARKVWRGAIQRLCDLVKGQRRREKKNDDSLL